MQLLNRGVNTADATALAARNVILAEALACNTQRIAAIQRAGGYEAALESGALRKWSGDIPQEV